ncbi:MAG: acyl-CoA thioesterase [Acidimicrobiia bacterium]
MDWPVTYSRKIRYSDTDPQGIVFNGNYLTYVDDTLTDYFDALGPVWNQMHDEGFDLVLGHVEIDFRSPARLGETVVTGAKATVLGNTSLMFALRAWEEASGRTVIEGSEVQVVVDAQTLEKRTVPPFLIEGIERLQGHPLTRK